VDRIAERIYGLREVLRILGLTPKRTAQLRRLDLLLNDAGYTFRDLLAVRAASSLLDAGASVRQIRQAVTSLKQRDQRLQSPLSELRLLVDGTRLLAQSDRVRFDPTSGQTLLDLGSGDLQQAADATLTTGLVRPLSPPAEQAETWFDRASEWEGDPAQWDDAIDAYRRVVAIDPTYAAAWNNLGLLLHRMGKYDDARAAYIAALEQDGSLCEAAYNLGSLWEDLSDVTQAIQHYRLALELAPDYADAHFNLAAALARAGRADEASRHWQRYLELDSSSPWARIARAHLELVEPGDGRPSTPRAPDGRSGE
jgi:tetratricopeptide (TPR) repeat protein